LLPVPREASGRPDRMGAEVENLPLQHTSCFGFGVDFAGRGWTLDGIYTYMPHRRAPRGLSASTTAGHRPRLCLHRVRRTHHGFRAGALRGYSTGGNSSTLPVSSFGTPIIRRGSKASVWCRPSYPGVALERFPHASLPLDPAALSLTTPAQMLFPGIMDAEVERSASTLHEALR